MRAGRALLSLSHSPCGLWLTDRHRHNNESNTERKLHQPGEAVQSSQSEPAEAMQPLATGSIATFCQLVLALRSKH